MDYLEDIKLLNMLEMILMMEVILQYILKEKVEIMSNLIQLVYILLG